MEVWTIFDSGTTSLLGDPSIYDQVDGIEEVVDRTIKSIGGKPVKIDCMKNVSARTLQHSIIVKLY